MIKYNEITIAQTFLMVYSYLKSNNSDELIYITYNKKSNLKYSYTHDNFKISNKKEDIVLLEDTNGTIKLLIGKYKETKHKKEKIDYLLNIAHIINSEIIILNEKNSELRYFIEHLSSDKGNNDYFINAYYDLQEPKPSIGVEKYGEFFFYFEVFSQAIYYTFGNTVIVFVPYKYKKGQLLLRAELYYGYRELPVNGELYKFIETMFNKNIVEEYTNNLLESLNLPPFVECTLVNPLLKFRALPNNLDLVNIKIKKKT